MTAKIKTHPRHDTRRRQTPRPKGVDAKTFQRVYWPFIPVLVTFCLLMSVAIRTVPLHHLGGRVLAYQTSRSTTELLKDTNIQRQKAGEQPLKMNDELVKAAQAKADDMASRDYWSHYTPEGVAPWSFVSATGYSYQSMGENLATGFSDDDAVVNAWMASPHHRENILDKNYSEVGFAYADNPNYTAAGGGPMTIVVAYYAQPIVIGIGATSPAKPSIPAQTLATTTTRLASGVASSALATWAPAILMLAGFASIILFFEKHRRYFLSAAVEGERYILRHPATDVGLLLIVGLVFLLAQAAGHIL